MCGTKISYCICDDCVHRNQCCNKKTCAGCDTQGQRKPCPPELDFKETTEAATPGDMF